MSELSIALILGTRRIGRRSGPVARWILTQLAEFRRVQTQILDLADLNIPNLEERNDQSAAFPDDARRFRDELARIDAILIVTPEYKNSFPGTLKNALDYLPPDAFRRKPVGIITVSSGALGGVNCLSQLRLVCLALGGLPIPDQLLFPNVQDAFDDEGRCMRDILPDRTRHFLLELMWYAEALKMHQSRNSEPA
jgi:NAD(P)H-dependent FMN reductase